MSDFGDRLASAFAELVEMSEAARQRYIEAVSADDPELAEELVSLLASHAVEEDFLAPPDAERIAQLLDEDERDRMPERAGPWSLIREIGRGGLGVVYLARRSDGDFEQQAAIKLLKRGMDSTAILRRFRNERRILASLEHPNIARLLDGGMLEDGQPWFAMEYVDGQTLTQWCERERLSVDQRLRLFLQVCRAVQSAHARLVVHRDLKPGNILVTGEGQVKLLDFGIAKLIDEEQGQGTALTRSGQAVMTPEYAAPEQIEGGPISVATDVYALGVVLYELLSGQHPYRAQASTREKLTAAILESCPDRPSDRLEAAVGGQRFPVERRQLSGDLDAIVLTAMAGAVASRYASVEALAEDVERHLEGLPIRARARSRAYRWGRFLRRYRLAVTALAAVLLALGTGLGMAVWQACEARHQAALAEQSREFAISLLSDIAPSTRSDGVEMRAVDLLLSAADRVEAADDLAPLIQGRLAAVIAEVLIELGSFERAVGLAELGVERLEASSEAGIGERANNYYVLARARISLGLDAAAEDAVVRGLALIERVAEPDDADRLTRIELLEMQARRLGNRYEAERAIALRQRALDDRIALFGPEHVNVAAGHNNLATELHTGGEFEAAEHHYAQVDRIMSAIDPEHPRRANVFLGLGVSQIAQGRLSQAEDSLARALEIAQAHYGEASGLVASCRAHMGHLRRLQQRFDAAYALFEQVAYPAERSEVGYAQAVASSWLGSLALTLGRSGEAIEHFQRSRMAMDALGQPAHPQALLASLGLSLSRSWAGTQAPDAEQIEALISSLFETGAGPLQLHGEGAELMAALMHALDRPAAAEAWQQRARALFTAHFGPEHPRTRMVGALYRQAEGAIALD